MNDQAKLLAALTVLRQRSKQDPNRSDLRYSYLTLRDTLRIDGNPEPKPTVFAITVQHTCLGWNYEAQADDGKTIERVCYRGAQLSLVSTQSRPAARN